ncbi:MAG TPA: SNF2-related protein [Blastocatellia bacterium]|nr:SNF2-related protein [Blastocatellia bacterium]
MSIVKKFSSSFPSTIRSRGLDYFMSGRVRIREGSKNVIHAVVRGTSDYRVELELRGRDLRASCECPYHLDDLCKHVWAVLLAAESRGHLSGSDPERIVMKEPDYGDDNAFDEGEDYGEYGHEIYEKWPKPAAFSRPAPVQPARPEPVKSSWRQNLDALAHSMKSEAEHLLNGWPAGREIIYVVDYAAPGSQGVVTEVAYRDRKKNGDWSKLKSQRIPYSQVAGLPEPADREILSLLMGGKEQQYYGYYNSYYESVPPRQRLFHPLEQLLLPLMCRTGRCYLRLSPHGDLKPARWDDGPAWEFCVEVRRGAGDRYVMTGSLRRGEERMGLSEPEALLKGGLVFARGRVARLDDAGAFAWIGQLQRQGPIYVPVDEAGQMLEELLALPRWPRLDLPEELRFEEVCRTPKKVLKVRKPEDRGWGQAVLHAELHFDYEGAIIREDRPGRGVYQVASRRLILRDAAAEQAAAGRLKQLGLRKAYDYHSTRLLELAPEKLPKVVRDLVAEDWHVEAEGRLYRQPGEVRVEVKSGIDWFELHGTVSFGDATASLPELLAALKRGEHTVRLGDGTFGVLSEEWLSRYGLFIELGSAAEDHLRFGRGQASVLDALLASEPEVTCDEAFARARDQLRSFEGIKAADPPPGFRGELREYQREGLGWLQFLDLFGFGGCLADDMGLGKTVMVLALLESRRELRANGDGRGQGKARAPKTKGGGGKVSRKSNGAAGESRPAPVGPSLVVVPKSLVFNWKQEAARFAPKLRLLDHTGGERSKQTSHFADYDAVITTYGTLRRDAVQFKETRFDYVILDEAQAIKNAGTESAKAARLLRGDHRLALSGTPVENHLGELWSLFEFLNPGLLGSASPFRSGAAGRASDEQTVGLLAKGLRPFILRRTKEQVAKELPRKLEQTIYCEMEPRQRRLYDELRDHYRLSLMGVVDDRGIARSKMQILEALLRLRQAACHPGLVDEAKAGESSAKLDLLLPQLSDVINEGYKALVFSQFTSLLAIVRDRLDREGITYEYLDGKTRDRRSRVERFQNDPDCRLFLISLKAGGLGLNLTAAEYVFLLDPWWNPAAEAQAIDRAHRIGQRRQVFAYRLIARGTVEEKVLELQQTKRALADAIINADNSLIRSLSREDLELLLS